MQPPRPLAIPIGHLSPVISITTLPPNVSRLSPNVSRQGPGRFGITPRWLGSIAQAAIWWCEPPLQGMAQGTIRPSPTREPDSDRRDVEDE